MIFQKIKLKYNYAHNRHVRLSAVSFDSKESTVCGRFVVSDNIELTKNSVGNLCERWRCPSSK